MSEKKQTVIHKTHFEDINLHVRSHSDSSWSLSCCHFKPQPSYCGLSTIMCVGVDISSSVVKADAWHQELWLFSGMGSWYEGLDVLEGIYCSRSLKSGALNFTLQNNDNTTWQYTTQYYATWKKGTPHLCAAFSLAVYFHRKLYCIDLISIISTLRLLTGQVVKSIYDIHVLYYQRKNVFFQFIILKENFLYCILNNSLNV